MMSSVYSVGTAFVSQTCCRHEAGSRIGILVPHYQLSDKTICIRMDFNATHRSMAMLCQSFEGLPTRCITIRPSATAAPSPRPYKISGLMSNS